MLAASTASSTRFSRSKPRCSLRTVSGRASASPRGRAGWARRAAERSGEPAHRARDNVSPRSLPDEPSVGLRLDLGADPDVAGVTAGARGVPERGPALARRTAADSRRTSAGTGVRRGPFKHMLARHGDAARKSASSRTIVLGTADDPDDPAPAYAGARRTQPIRTWRSATWADSGTTTAASSKHHVGRDPLRRYRPRARRRPRAAPAAPLNAIRHIARHVVDAERYHDETADRANALRHLRVPGGRLGPRRARSPEQCLISAAARARAGLHRRRRRGRAHDRRRGESTSPPLKGNDMLDDITVFRDPARLWEAESGARNAIVFRARACRFAGRPATAGCSWILRSTAPTSAADATTMYSSVLATGVRDGHRRGRPE